MPSFQKAAALLAAATGGYGRALDSIYHDGENIAPCSSVLYCHGEILDAVQMAKPFADSKTFVDMPTKVPLRDLQSAYDQLTKPLHNNTELLDFLGDNFGPAGQEVIPVDPGSLFVNASFLDGIENAVNREFTEAVIKLWPNLTRSVNESAICPGCERSLLSIKRPFVVAGGRFREPYYWDSYWILHGLLRSGGDFIAIARDQIENFLDFVADYGFVPNGARVYYLNRSQPPLLAQMVRIYLEQTGDTSILDRAVPLLIKEHDFFMSNRTVQVPIEDKNHTLNRYNVANTEPRPESYFEDYTQVNNASYHAIDGRIIPARNTTQAEKDLQYSNLASGAESGWDYTARFMTDPNIAANNTYFPLASYNIINIVPVELNAILYWNEVTIAGLLRRQQAHNDTAKAEADEWDARAASRSEAMHAVMWNETLGSYFDFNLTSGAQDVFWARDADSLPSEQAPGGANQQVVFNIGQLFPFWTGAAPRSVAGDPAVMRRVFSRVDEYLGSRKGGIAPTNFVSGQQWDQSNVWPPHMQVLMEALLRTAGEAVEDGDGAGSSEEWAWAHDLALRIGQRYFDSAYCTWRATGGGTPSAPPLPNPLQNLGGQMFEKYSDQSLHEAGGGGEYTVAVGFGWSNGALIWTADTFRDQLQTPVCDDLFATDGPGTRARRLGKRGEHGDGANAASAVELDYFDATWTSENVGGLRPVN
ncbi:hypothetical protein KVR01_000073 [Diaporthe batatas]|uniref:uncharacterized protein n=1 Tax=Diaporthe batatas TaxID=748121 RepID=UPI001D04CEA2|nr:uncharacterized protein KVR01_000073 [Diaporthe batatas]KAG8169328.1 hypothetical protein KVR01_000073 [Diaporthe batatas]